MNSTKTTNYIKGSAKEVVFADGGDLINVDMLSSDLEKLPKNEAGYIKIVLSRLKDGPDQYGNTHSIKENTFKPSKGKSGAPKLQGSAKKTAAPTTFKKQITGATTDDLPF